MTEAEKPLVKKYFGERRPDLREMLDNSGAFWSRVQDNTIPAPELRDVIYFMEVLERRNNSATAAAAHLLLELRGEGLLSIPGGDRKVTLPTKSSL